MKATIDAKGVLSLRTNKGVNWYLYRQGLAVRRHAVTHAPFKTGAYKGSLGVDRMRYGVIRVRANDRKAMWLEYGTGHPAPSPHFETLTEAVRAQGFKRVVYLPHVRKGKRK